MEAKGALLTVAIPLIVFKIWFAILLVSYAPTRDTTAFLVATHWPLLVILGLLIAPGIAVYRMLKVRAKREQLKRAEFQVDAVQCSALWDTVSRLEGGD